MNTKINPKLYLVRGGRNGEDETYAIDNGVLTVQLTDAANGIVIADVVQIVKVA